MKSIRDFIMIVILIVTVIVVGYANPSLAAQTVKIGAMLPFTGHNLMFGKPLQRGIELAFDQAGWKAGGRKIELMVEDEASDTTVCRDKATKLVERDKVSIIIGPLHAPGAIANMPYLEKNKVINLCVGQYPLGVAKAFSYMILPGGTLNQCSYQLGAYAYNQRGYRTAIVMAPDFVPGHEFAGGFTTRFKELGGRVVQERWYPVETVDFAAYLSVLGKADAVAMWAVGPGALRLVKQYEEYGLFKRMPMMAVHMSGAFDEATLLPAHGDAALGIIGAIPYATTIKTKANQDFLKAYKTKYQKVPDINQHMGYIAALVAVKALEAAGADASPEKLRDTLLGLSYQIPSGPLRFTSDGIAIRSVFIVENAKIEGRYVWKVIHEYPEVGPPPPVAK